MMALPHKGHYGAIYEADGVSASKTKKRNDFKGANRTMCHLRVNLKLLRSVVRWRVGNMRLVLVVASRIGRASYPPADSNNGPLPESSATFPSPTSPSTNS
jgi:hypothetical protein